MWLDVRAPAALSEWCHSVRSPDFPRAAGSAGEHPSEHPSVSPLRSRRSTYVRRDLRGEADVLFSVLDTAEPFDAFLAERGWERAEMNDKESGMRADLGLVADKMGAADVHELLRRCAFVWLADYRPLSNKWQLACCLETGLQCGYIKRRVRADRCRRHRHQRLQRHKGRRRPQRQTPKVHLVAFAGLKLRRMS